MTQYRNLIRAVAITLLAAAPLSAEAAPAASAPAAASAIHSTSYHFATVNGRKIFYREAGDPAAPTIVLLHGFPSSSQMYRDLIPQLADKFHVIAPDYVGFGQSDAPPASEFDYNFDNLAYKNYKHSDKKKSENEYDNYTEREEILTNAQFEKKYCIIAMLDIIVFSSLTICKSKRNRGSSRTNWCKYPVNDSIRLEF